MPTAKENLYNALIDNNFNFRDYESFSDAIKSESTLQNLYKSALEHNFNLPSYPAFREALNDTTDYPTEQDNIPTVSLTPKDAGRGSYDGIASFPYLEDIKGSGAVPASGDFDSFEKRQQANTQKIDAYENKLREVKNQYVNEYKASMPNTYEGYVSMLNATDDAKKVYLEKLNSPDPMVAYQTMQDIKGKLDSGDYEGDKNWIPEWAENLMAGREGESKLKIAREEKADKDNLLKNGIEGIYQEQQHNKEFGQILTAPLASNPDVLKNSFTQYGLNQMVGYNPVALDAGLSELQSPETSILSKQMPGLVGAQLYKQQANEIFQQYTNSNEFKQANEILKNTSSYPQETIDWANNFVGQVTTIGNNIGAADNFISKQTVALDEQKRQVSQNALLERMMSPNYDRPRDYTRAALTGLNIAKGGLAATIGTGVVLGAGEGLMASGGNPVGAGVGALMGGVAVTPAALTEAGGITGSSAALEKYAPGAIDIADYKLKEENLKSIGWIRSLFGDVDKAIGENTVHNFDISKENGLVNPIVLQAFDKNLKPTDLNFLKENWSLNVPAAFYDVVNTMSGSNVFGGVTRVSNAITKAAKLGKVGQEVAAIGANTISGIIQDDGRSIENYYKQTGNIGLSKALGVFGSGVEAFTESIWNPTGMIGLGVDDIATGARRMAFDELKNATSAIEKGAIRFAKTNIEELGEEFGGAAIMRGAVGAAQASGLSGANNLDTNQLSPLELAKTALLTIASTSPMAARAGQQEASAFRNVLNYNIGMQADDMRTHLNQQFQDNKISNSDYHQAMANVDKQQAAYQTASSPFEQARLRVQQLYNLSQQPGLPTEVASRLADLHQTSFDALENSVFNEMTKTSKVKDITEIYKLIQEGKHLDSSELIDIVDDYKKNLSRISNTANGLNNSFLSHIAFAQALVNAVTNPSANAQSASATTSANTQTGNSTTTQQSSAASTQGAGTTNATTSSQPSAQPDINNPTVVQENADSSQATPANETAQATTSTSIKDKIKDLEEKSSKLSHIQIENASDDEIKSILGNPNATTEEVADYRKNLSDVKSAQDIIADPQLTRKEKFDLLKQLKANNPLLSKHFVQFTSKKWTSPSGVEHSLQLDTEGNYIQPKGLSESEAIKFKEDAEKGGLPISEMVDEGAPAELEEDNVGEFEIGNPVQGTFKANSIVDLTQRAIERARKAMRPSGKLLSLLYGKASFEATVLRKTPIKNVSVFKDVDGVVKIKLLGENHEPLLFDANGDVSVIGTPCIISANDVISKAYSEDTIFNASVHKANVIQRDRAVPATKAIDGAKKAFVFDSEGKLSLLAMDENRGTFVFPISFTSNIDIDTSRLGEEAYVNQLLAKAVTRFEFVPAGTENVSVQLGAPVQVLNRSSALDNRDVSAEQEQRAKEWFESSPLAKHITLKRMKGIVNSQAWANWVDSVVTLFSGSNDTDLYHESWHEFSQKYLTKAQKSALYNSVQSTPSGKKAIQALAKEKGVSIEGLNDAQKYFAIEELIAEDFREYALSNGQLVLGKQKERNTIFRKVWSFIKEAITGEVDLQEVYDRLYTGNIGMYERSDANAMQYSLNSSIVMQKPNGESWTLNAFQESSVYKAIDSLVSDNIKRLGVTIGGLKSKSSLLQVLDAVKKDLEGQAQYLEQALKLHPENADLIEASIDRTREILANWNNIQGSYIIHSELLKENQLKYSVSEEDIEDFSTEEDAITKNDLAKNENRDFTAFIAPTVRLLISSLKKTIGVEPVMNTMLPYVQDTVDFYDTVRDIVSITHTSLSYEQIVNKLEAEVGKKAYLRELIDSLPPIDRELTPDEHALKVDFFETFSLPYVDAKKVYEYTVGENDTLVKRIAFSSLGTTNIRDLFNKFYSNAITRALRKGKYTTSNGNIDTIELLKKYNKSVLNQKNVNGVLARKNFFKVLGFEFPNLTLEQESELFSRKEFGSIIDILIPPMEKSQRLSVKFLYAKIPVALKTEISNRYEELYGSGLKMSVKDAEDKSRYLLRQWSAVTRLVAAINNANSLDELIKQPDYYQFDKTKNPFVDGVYFKALFDEKGKKRIGEDGKSVTIEVIDLAQMEVGEVKPLDKLSATEKVIFDMASGMIGGVFENPRYGDKVTAYGLRLSHTYQELQEGSKVFRGYFENSGDAFANGKAHLDFSSDEGKERLYRIAVNYVLNDARAMWIAKHREVGKKWKNYSENIKDFGASSILFPKEVLDELYDISVSSPTPDAKAIQLLMAKNKTAIISHQEALFNKEANRLKKVLRYANIPTELSAMFPNGRLTYNYAVRQFVSNYEHNTLISFDPRFYKASRVSEKEQGERLSTVKDTLDYFKRLSAWSATGTSMLIDAQTVASVLPRVTGIRDAFGKVAEQFSKGANEIRSSIFNDKILNAKDWLKEIILHLEKSGASKSVIDLIKEEYSKITETDAQGFATLDLYKEMMLRSNPAHWTDTHEAAYQKEVAFMKGESETGINPIDASTLFVVKKMQYAGNIIDKGYALPGFYKFAVIPLIPSQVKGTSYEAIHKNMLRQNIGLGLFNSASKISNVEVGKQGSVDEAGKGNDNKFYSNYETNTANTTDWIANTILFSGFKEQVNNEPKFKEKITITSQLRKLIFSGLASNGKFKTPAIKALFDKYVKLNHQLYNNGLNSFLTKFANETADGWQIDNDKFKEWLEVQFDNKNLAPAILDLIQTTPSGKLVMPLQSSPQWIKLQDAIMTSIYKNTVVVKVRGEAYVQVAPTGFEKLGKTQLQEDKGLSFYSFDKDGNLLPQEVKIAFSNKWKPLLSLKHTDGTPIRTLERLNEMLGVNSFREAHKDFIEFTTVRIPTQGLNSMDYMTIKELLPASNGAVMVASPLMVVKTGNDFDFDKSFASLPNMFVDTDGNVKLNKYEELKGVDAQKPNIKNILDGVLKELSDTKKELSDVVPLDVKEARRLEAKAQRLRSQQERVKNYMIEIEELSNIGEASKEMSNILIKAFGVSDMSALALEFLTLDTQINSELSKIEAIGVNTEFKPAEKGLYEKEKGLRKQVAGLEELLEYYSAQKAIENELLSIQKEILSKHQNHATMLKPNSTSLFSPFANLLKSKELIGFGNLSLASLNLSQFDSSYKGKNNVGIAAKANTFIALMQAAGTKMRIKLPFASNVDGDYVEFGKTNNINNQPIADYIEQLINGFVDVVKDAWVFDLNFKQDILPTALMLYSAGVSHRTILAFVANPVLIDYISLREQGLSVKDAANAMGVSLVKMKDIDEDALQKATFSGGVYPAGELIAVYEYLKKIGAPFSELSILLSNENKKIETYQQLKDYISKIKSIKDKAVKGNDGKEHKLWENIDGLIEDNAYGYLNSTNGLYKRLVDTFGALLDSEWVESKNLNFLARNVFKDLDAKFSNLTNETNSFYVRFVEMKNKYPHLIERYPLLDKIESNIQENYGKGLYVGLKLSENISDVDQVETYMQNLVDMREFYDKNLNEEDNAEVREFLKDFGDFLVYQNVYNSQVNLASTSQIMPYQFYSRRMAQAMSKIASMPKNMKKVIIENIKTGNNVNLETPSYASRVIVGTISEANKNDQEVLQVSGVRLRDISDKDINNSFATIDLMVSAIIDKFNAGIELIEFPEKGLGQDLKAKSPVSFEYLSQKMYELTGYRNPNAEIIEDLDNTEETPGCTLPI